MYPTYSPDLIPSGYYMFLSLVKVVCNEEWASREDCEVRVLIFFWTKVSASDIL